MIQHNSLSVKPVNPLRHTIITADGFGPVSFGAVSNKLDNSALFLYSARPFGFRLPHLTPEILARTVGKPRCGRTRFSWATIVREAQFVHDDTVYESFLRRL